jgi:hypothetical protein
MSVAQILDRTTGQIATNYLPPAPPGGSGTLSEVLTNGNDAEQNGIINLGPITFNDTVNEATIDLAAGLGPTLQVLASDGVTRGNLLAGTVTGVNVLASSVIGSTGTGYIITDNKINIGDAGTSQGVDLVTDPGPVLNVYNQNTTTPAALNVSSVNYLQFDQGTTRTILSSDLQFTDARNAITYVRPNSIIALRVQDSTGVPYITLDTTMGAGNVYLFQPLNIGALREGSTASLISTNTVIDMGAQPFSNVSVIELSTTHTSGTITVNFNNLQNGRVWKVLLNSIAAGGSVSFPNIGQTFNKGQEGYTLELIYTAAADIKWLNPIFNTFMSRKHMSADQAFTASQSAIVQFNTVTFSTPNSNWIDTTTNANGYVITTAGYYRINCNHQWNNVTTLSGRTGFVQISTDGGSTWNYITRDSTTAQSTEPFASVEMYCVAYLDVGTWVGSAATNGSTNATIVSGNTPNSLGINTFFVIEKLN